MGLLVDQYKENGTKIIDHLTARRGAEKAEASEKLGDQRHELVSMYAEAKEFIDMTDTESKKNSITTFDKDWRKAQDNIQKKISDGRRGLERCRSVSIGDVVYR